MQDEYTSEDSGLRVVSPKRKSVSQLILRMFLPYPELLKAGGAFGYA